MAAIIDHPLYHLGVTTDAEGTTAPNVHRVTCQVRNRRNDVLKAGFIVHVWLSLAAGGGPQNAQTVAFVSGTVLETVVPNGEWRVLTTSNGLFVFDVTIAGAATRFVEGFVLCEADVSDPIVWT